MRRKPPPPVTLPLFPWPTPRTDDFRNPLSHPIPAAARGTPLSPASPPALRCTCAGVLADDGGGWGWESGEERMPPVLAPERPLHFGRPQLVRYHGHLLRSHGACASFPFPSPRPAKQITGRGEEQVVEGGW